MATHAQNLHLDTTTQLDTNDTTLHFDTITFGSVIDPPVIVSPGAGATKACNLFWAPELAKRGFYVICYDIRDLGGSSKCNVPADPVAEYGKALQGEEYEGVPYSCVDMARDVIRVMDQFNLERAHVAGLSMGGALSMYASVYHPERCITCIAAASNYDMHDGLAEAATTEEGKALGEIMAQYPQPQKGCTREEFIEAKIHLLKALIPAASDEVLMEMIGADWDNEHVDWDMSAGSRTGLAFKAWEDSGGFAMFQEKMRSNTVATLVVHGEKDPIQSFSQAKKLVENRGASELLSHNGGHNFGDTKEKQDEVLDEIAAFMKSHM